MKNQKNGSNAPKMHFWAKLPIISPPKVWVCSSPYVDGNEKLVSAIMTNQKNGSNAPKMHPRAKLPIIGEPQTLKFRVCGVDPWECCSRKCKIGALEPLF